jgi:hypothetical protein
MSNNDQDDKLARLEQILESELCKIKNEVDDLYKTVYKGNGSPSLMTKVNSVENKLRGLRETLDDKITHITTENHLRFDSLHQKLESKFGRLEGWIDTKFGGLEKSIGLYRENTKIDRSGSWQLKAAIITSVTAIVGTGLALFFR